MVDYIKHICKLEKIMRIVVVAAVVHVEFSNPPPKLVANNINVHVVALRLSDDTSKGRGGDDTADRMFNTTTLN